MGGERAGSIGALVLRLIDNAKSFARAEIALAKLTAFEWLAQARVGLILIVIAIMLVMAALPVLLAAFGIALAPWLGVAGGLGVVALIAIVGAILLAVAAIKRLQGIGK